MAFIESLPYTVIKKEKKFEIRRYDEFYLATVTTKDDGSFSNGFNRVFHYIGGENENKEKISMTTPVVNKVKKTSSTLSFYVPGSYSYEEIPRPLDTDVTIEKEPAQVMATVRFSGRWTKENFDTHTELLKEYIKDSGFDIQSNRYIFRYNPPIVPFFLRKNEVAFRILYDEDC